MNRYLVIEEYRSKDEVRQGELDMCFIENGASRLFEYIVEAVGPDPRVTIKGIFEGVNAMKWNEGDMVVIANADMLFEDSLMLADDLKEDECYALSRWEDGDKIQRQVNGDSQDCWIFRWPIKNVDKMDIDFPLGKMGCDNRLAYEIQKAGYKVTNPSKSIKTWHLHKSNARNYSNFDRNESTVVPPPYLIVPVTSLPE